MCPTIILRISDGHKSTDNAPFGQENGSCCFCCCSVCVWIVSRWVRNSWFAASAGEWVREPPLQYSFINIYAPLNLRTIQECVFFCQKPEAHSIRQVKYGECRRGAKKRSRFCIHQPPDSNSMPSPKNVMEVLMVVVVAVTTRRKSRHLFTQFSSDGSRTTSATV